MTEGSSPEGELPEELAGLVKPELQPGERLLWASRAYEAPGIRRRGGRRAAEVWAVIFLAGATACTALTFGSHPRRDRQSDEMLVAFALLFGIIGLLIAISAFVRMGSAARDLRLGGRKIYAVTDRRAIVWSPVARSEAVTVHVFPRGTIRPEQIERTQFPDGSGSLSIQGAYAFHGRFEGIADVRRVEELVRRYLVAPEPGPTP